MIRHTVINLRTAHPDWTLETIGKIVNRTRERVRQILISEGLEHRSTKSAYSRQPAHLKKGQPCKKCGIPVPYKERSYPNGCKSGNYPAYCSIECRPKLEEIELTCFYCNKTYILSVPQARYRQLRVAKGLYKATYCSHSCSSQAYWDIIRGKTPNNFDYNTKYHQKNGPWGNKDPRRRKVQV